MLLTFLQNVLYNIGLFASPAQNLRNINMAWFSWKKVEFFTLWVTFSETLELLLSNNSGAIHGRVPRTPPETSVLRLILDNPKSPTWKTANDHKFSLTWILNMNFNYKTPFGNYLVFENSVVFSPFLYIVVFFLRNIWIQLLFKIFKSWGCFLKGKYQIT